MAATLSRNAYSVSCWLCLLAVDGGSRRVFSTVIMSWAPYMFKWCFEVGAFNKELHFGDHKLHKTFM
ncbi:hypothetical protein S83_033822 [Arachis hypogaea]